MAGFKVVTPALEHTHTRSHAHPATGTHQVEGDRAAEERVSLGSTYAACREEARASPVKETALTQLSCRKRV